MESQFKNTKPKKLPTLTQLLIAKLKRHVSQISDVGNTPFHLLEPVLQQMPFKQLKQLEENCNQLIPHSDKLWMKLIAKDFPNRPVKIDPLKSSSPTSSSTTSFNNMPYKSLYFKYCKDRDDFRKDSARKLRNANKSIEKEKSKTKIIAVDQVLRDPSIRKVNSTSSNPGFTKSIQPINKNSILQKAKRDTVQSRNLLFARNQYIKPYDPFHAFKVNDTRSNNDPIRPPRSSSVRRTTFFNATSESLKNSTTASTITTTRTKPRLKTDDAMKPESDKPLPITSPVKPPLTSQKSSIFIQRKRKSPSPMTKTTSTSKRIKKPVQQKEPPSKIKRLKSSIFS